MRRGCLTSLLTSLALLVAVLVGVDRLGCFLAERGVAAELGRRGATGADVHISGFPFLTQLGRRHFSDVTIESDSWTRESLSVGRVTARLHDVRASSADAGHVGSVVATALVPYATIEARAGLPAGSLRQDGTRVRVTRTVTVLGRRLTASGSATIGVRNGALLIAPSSVTLPGPVPQAVTDAALRSLTLRYSLTGLPLGLRVQRLTVAPTGVVVTVTGSSLTVSR